MSFIDFQKSNAAPPGPVTQVCHVPGAPMKSQRNHSCGRKNGCTILPLVVGNSAHVKSGVPLGFPKAATSDRCAICA
eukprot:7793252-Pyramimonas_sp.AAC.1